MHNGNTKRRWTREEYLLTLDLYKQLKSQKASLGAANPDVKKLARLINRKPGSVSMRLLNYLNYEEGEGKGLNNGGRECVHIWEQYGNNDEALNHAVAEISSIVGINSIDKILNSKNISDDTIISMTGEQANKIAVLLSVAMRQDMGQLYSALISIVGADINSCVDFKSLDQVSRQVQSLPNINMETLEGIMNHVVGATEASRIVGLIALFDKRFRK